MSNIQSLNNMNIQSHYIDFRDEHRIYLLGGILYELVGMIADTDYDDWDENSFSSDPSPRTWYKLILNSEYMYDGGHYEEGSLPHVFARRGDTIGLPNLLRYLLENVFFRVDNACILMEELSGLDLKVDDLKKVDLTLRLYPVHSGFRVVSELHNPFDFPLIFVKSPDDRKGIIFSYEGNEDFFTFRKLATEIGRIVFALQDYFKRDIEIVHICRIEGECTPQEREAELPKGYSQFLRLVRIAAEKERNYWKKFETNN